MICVLTPMFLGFRYRQHHVQRFLRAMGNRRRTWIALLSRSKTKPITRRSGSVVGLAEFPRAGVNTDRIKGWPMIIMDFPKWWFLKKGDPPKWLVHYYYIILCPRVVVAAEWCRHSLCEEKTYQSLPVTLVHCYFCFKHNCSVYTMLVVFDWCTAPNISCTICGK